MNGTRLLSKKLPTSLFFFEVGANTKKISIVPRRIPSIRSKRLDIWGLGRPQGDRPYGETINTEQAFRHTGVRTATGDRP